jgi:uncharacterized membrane protein YeaQ/YmgE (transglycosylase-associated protein family)
MHTDNQQGIVLSILVEIIGAMVGGWFLAVLWRGFHQSKQLQS